MSDNSPARGRRSAPSLVLALLLASTLSGCDDSSPLGPVAPDEVSVRLEVSGGIAGVDYALIVDGAEGRVVGASCAWQCDFQEGDVLLPVSPDQVAALAGRLEAAGVLGLDGRDFGRECCDDFYFDLTYERGERSSRVTGGGGSLPADLAAAVGLLHGLVRGVAPLLVSPETRDVDWPRDAYTLGSVAVDGLTLTAELTFSGGCGEHRMDLVAWGGWMESYPVQVNALVTHDDGDDPCDGILVEERAYDLAPLREAYEAAYGTIGDDRPTVVLRLWDPLAAGPLGRLVEVVL